MASSTALSSRLLTPIPNPNINPNPNPSPKTLHLKRPSLSFSIKCSQSPPPPPSAPAVAAADHLSSSVSSKLRRLVGEFRGLPSPLDRVKLLLHYASLLPPFPDSDCLPSNRVMGCTAAVWLSASLSPDGTLAFAADSDSELTKGFCACLISVVNGAEPEEVLSLRPEDFGDLNVGVGMPGRKAQSRANTWHNVLVSMQKRARMLVAKEEGRTPLEMFPSLVIAADGVEAKGSYAEAQVRLDMD